MPDKLSPIVVIGAGIGGLSAAIRLASSGRRVIVYEKQPWVGGKMGELRLGGYRFDTGPSVITLRSAFDELFRLAKRSLEDYLDFQAVDPLTRYFYPTGRILDIHRELAPTLNNIAAIEARDVEGYLSYLAYAARLFRITAPVFIFDQPPGLHSFTKVPWQDMFKIDGLRTMQQAIDRYVQSAELRQLLGRFATYVGASPYLAPATLNVIAHVELNQGVWYPAGGIYQIARALERLAIELGVEIHTGCGVRQIDVRLGEVHGVILEDGRHIPASALVANLDVAAAQALLNSEGALPARESHQFSRSETSCSGFILMLGIRGQHPSLAHHNIFFSSDYRREFEEIFQQGIPPTEPTIYVAITSKTTPQDAPAGSENWFVLVNAPALGSAWNWQAQRKGYRQRVLDLLAQRGYDVRDQIEVERVWTPVELEEMSGAYRGALYGASSNNRWAAFRRPHNRNLHIRGLYFAGGTVHPGGGVPMVILSGLTATKLLMEDGF